MWHRSAAATTGWIAINAGSARRKCTTPSSRSCAAHTVRRGIHQKSYAGGVTDEFVVPGTVVDADDRPIGPIRDGDSVIFQPDPTVRGS